MPSMDDTGRGLIVFDDSSGEDYGTRAAMTRDGAMGIIVVVMHPIGIRCREILGKFDQALFTERPMTISTLLPTYA